MGVLENFVKVAKAGKLRVQSGRLQKGQLLERYDTIGVDDLDALTAEAFNQEVLPAGTTWENGLAAVKRALSEMD